MVVFDRISQSLPEALAGALRRLAHLTQTSLWDQWASHKLTPTQRKILMFLGTHRDAVGLSAVAGELGVTPASASDSVAALENKGLLRKRRNNEDARAVAILLTAEGRKVLSALAALPDSLRTAFGSLSGEEQEAFYRMAIKMIRSLQEAGAMPITRMCVRCKYFDPFRYPDSATPNHCHLVGAPFADRHLRIDCPDQLFNEPAAQQALWVRFNANAASPKVSKASPRARRRAARGQ